MLDVDRIGGICTVKLCRFHPTPVDRGPTRFINLTLTETQITNVEAALATLETELGGLIALSAKDKLRMRRKGEKGESFRHQALRSCWISCVPG